MLVINHIYSLHVSSGTYKSHPTPTSPPFPAQFTEAVINLKFDEEPKYDTYIRLFQPLCGSSDVDRPIMIEGAARVGLKRGRDTTVEELEEQQPKKKIRLGAPAN